MARTATHSNPAAFALPTVEAKKSLQGLREERAELLDKAKAILAIASEAKRDLNKIEAGEFDIAIAKAADLEPEIRKLEAEEAVQAKQAVELALKLYPHAAGSDKPILSQNDRQWVDSAGRPVAVFGKGDSFVRSYASRGAGELSVGNLVRAIVTGNGGFAQRELQVVNSMSGGSNTGGGFMVPIELSAMVLDKARAASAVMRAGTLMVPMTSDTLTMAAIESDAEFETHTENQTITESDMTFGARTFTSRTIATIVRMSRELAADAPNAAMLVENALARALAAELDRQGTAGTGSQEEMGLTVDGAIGETGSVGAIAWEDLHAAVIAIQTANYQPNGFLISPTINGDLTLLTTGDGTNAAKGWLTAPPLVAPLTPFVTTNMPDTAVVVGDFTQCAYGLRQAPLLEVTTTGHDAFSKHSVLIKVSWRGCFRTLQPGAFHRLAGVTT